MKNERNTLESIFSTREREKTYRCFLALVENRRCSIFFDNNTDLEWWGFQVKVRFSLKCVACFSASVLVLCRGTWGHFQKVVVFYTLWNRQSFTKLLGTQTACKLPFSKVNNMQLFTIYPFPPDLFCDSANAFCNQHAVATKFKINLHWAHCKISITCSVWETTQQIVDWDHLHFFGGVHFAKHR